VNSARARRGPPLGPSSPARFAIRMLSARTRRLLTLGALTSIVEQQACRAVFRCRGYREAERQMVRGEGIKVCCWRDAVRSLEDVLLWSNRNDLIHRSGWALSNVEHKSLPTRGYGGISAALVHLGYHFEEEFDWRNKATKCFVNVIALFYASLSRLSRI
jgi:hypothetical protein